MRCPILFSLAFLLFFSSCESKKKRFISPAFYFWKTTFNLSPEYQQEHKKAGLKKLYIRLFDVDNDGSGKSLPVADLCMKTQPIEGLEIIPVVFITNRTLLSTPDTLIDDLAQKISKRIFQHLSAIKTTCKELQFDCDWSLKTKDKYFRFLIRVKTLNAEKKLIYSATIRLHQVKYASKTGVPPVDRGMLMAYNMGSLKNPQTKNSIFDADVARTYLLNMDKYPLKLDIVLPYFSWGVVLRGGKVMHLLNDVDPLALQKSSFAIQSDKNCYDVKINYFYDRFGLRKGDKIRIETVDDALTTEAAALFEPYLKSDSLVVAIYHLNPEKIQNDKPDFQKVYNLFY